MSVAVIFLRSLSILLLMTQAVTAASLNDILTGIHLELPAKWGVWDRSFKGNGWFMLYRMPRQPEPEAADRSHRRPNCAVRTHFGSKIMDMNIRDPDFLDAYKRRYASKFSVSSARRFARGNYIGFTFAMHDVFEMGGLRLVGIYASSRSQIVIICFTNQDEYRKIKPEFDVIYRGVRFPRPASWLSRSRYVKRANLLRRFHRQDPAVL